jgi:hypothetical protein
VWIGPLGLLPEIPTRDFDDAAAMHIPTAFPRQVRKDPIGHIDLHFLALPLLRLSILHSRGEVLSGSVRKDSARAKGRSH